MHTWSIFGNEFEGNENRPPSSCKLEDFLILFAGTADHHALHIVVRGSLGGADEALEGGTFPSPVISRGPFRNSCMNN